MAQGMQQAFGAIAQGITQFSQNQQMAKTAMGRFQGAIAANPELVKLFESGRAPAEAQKAYEKFKTGKVDVWDASYLANVGDSFVEAQKQQQAMEEQRMRLEAFKRQQADEAQCRAQFDAFAKTQSLAKNPFFVQAAQIRQATGEAPSANAMLEQSTRTAGATKATPDEITLPGGARVAFSPSTGAFSVLPQTPKQIADAEAAKSEADLNAKGASAFLTDITDGAEAARNTVASVDRVIGLYKEGAQSGFGQPLITQSRAAFARFGLGTGVETQQQYEQELFKLSIEARKQLMKGTGQVSDYESKMVERAQANPNLTPEANIRILTVQRNAAARAIKLDQLRTELEDQGLSNVEIARRLRRARDKMPIGIDSIMDLTGGESAQQAVPAAASAAPASPWNGAKEKRLRELQAKLSGK